MDGIKQLAAAVARMSFPVAPGPVCIRDGRGRLLRLEPGNAARLRGAAAGDPLAAAAVAAQRAMSCFRPPIATGGPAPAPLEQLIIPALRKQPEGLPAWAAEAIRSPEEPLLELVLAASQQPGSLVAVDRLAGGAMAFQPLPAAASLVLEAIAAVPVEATTAEALPASRRPLGDRDKPDYTKLIDEYLVRCNREAPQDADTFLVAKGKRQARMLIDAGLLTGGASATDIDRHGQRLDTASRKHPRCIAARNKAAVDADDNARPEQEGHLFDSGASKRKLPRNRLPQQEGAYDPKLCEQCNVAPKGYGVDGKFCSLDSKQLSRREQEEIASGERDGEWEGLASHRLHELRLKAACIPAG